ncbi:hypothetical protein M8745_19555, partial [Lutimaribacter sp. EGI FJ00014]|nr:hypothetical protein [Lutimaribacter sp. EGI FJ00014]
MATILAFLPWMLIHIPRLGGKLGGEFWISNNWSVIFTRLAAFAIGAPVVFAAVAVVVIGSLVRRPYLMRQPEYFVSLVAMGIILMAALAISFHTPVITDRNLFILIPPFYIVSIAAFSDLEDIGGGSYRQVLRAVPAAIAAVSLGVATYRMATETKEQWRDAAALIVSLPGCEVGPLPVNQLPKEFYAYYLPPGYRDRLLE